MRRLLPKRFIVSRVCAALALFISGTIAHAQTAPTIQTSTHSYVNGFGLPIPNARLDSVRGGFDLGSGLEASFGVQRSVYVDGTLVYSSSVNIPDIAHITSQQAEALASAMGTVNVQVGSGNSFTPSSLGQTSATTVIQNTLNNQTIRNLTTLNVAVNTLNAFREQGLQQALQNASVQALGH